MTFEDWLGQATRANGAPLSSATAYKYNHGFATVSREMLEAKVIAKPLESMNLYEPDLALLLIFSDESFLKKDEIGDKMYSNALKRYRNYIFSFAETSQDEAQAERDIASDSSLSATEREQLCKARIGQGVYRDKLIDKFHGQCIITHINIPTLLTASHIKPWAVCDNHDRLSGDNGLLLSATYDRLFDGGYISFENDGELIVSSLVSRDNAAKLKLKTGDRYNLGFNKVMGDFLEYHRDTILVR